MTATRVLWIGDESHGEFSEPLAWLREYCDVTAVATVAEGTAFLEPSTHPPQVLVLAASRPGLFDQSSVAALLSRVPLARCVGLLGGWCEGELRTGRPWRGVTRVYWHEFLPRLAAELIERNRRGRLAMPRTFTEAEFSELNVTPPANPNRGLIAIRAVSLECYEAIADVCRALGNGTVWVHPRQPAFFTDPIAAIWDVATSVELEQTELAQFASRVEPAPLIACLSFPRSSDRQLACECGARGIVSKPYSLQELWTELVRVAAPSEKEVRIGAA